MDEPRNTDNAWFETTACHFHCSRELGALLPLKQAPDNLTNEQQGLLEDYHSDKPQSEEWRQSVREDLGLNDIFWLNVEDVADDKDIYASHRDWIIVVRQRLDQLDTHPGLLQLVAQWGRVDVLEDVLKDPDLLAQRQPMQVQMAFQGALEHAIEPNFDLGLIELLMETGAKAADVYLPALFDLKGRDRFGLFTEIQHRRMTRFGTRMSLTLRGKSARQSSSVSLTPPSPKRSPSRLKLAPSVQERGVASAGLKRWRAGVRCATLVSMPISGEKQKTDGAVVDVGGRQRRPSQVRSLKHKELLGDDEDPRLARSPWRSEHIRFIEKFVKGFGHYAREQHALHNVDLMFWAITAGALDLAELFWRRCRSPLRAALIAQYMLTQIRLKGLKDAALEESVALFSQHAVGVLEHLPNQETARRLLLSTVGDFATIGSPGSMKDSILGLAIVLQNKDFVSQRYCQEILDDMWWGRSSRSGRVCLQKPWPSWYSVVAQVMLPFIRILPVVPNDLCVGYPWMTDKELSDSNGEKKVNVKWWRAMLAIWHIPRMKRAVVSISMVLFTLLFISVFLDRLCGPLTAERGVCFWLFVVWTFANVVQEALQFMANQQHAWKNLNLLEICTLFLLFAACGLRWILTSPRGHIGHTAENLGDFINYQSGGRIQPQLHSTARAREENYRYTWINAGAEDSGFEGECPWSIELECLRAVLGVVAPLLMLRFTEFLTMRADIGVLMVCTKRMLVTDLMPWLTFVMVAVMVGSSLSLSFLAPAYQLEAGNGPFKPFGGLGWGPTELDISPGGPFWVSFWGLFGFYEPAEISTSTGSSFLAPLFLGFYMMLVAVVFINLLIAMFNQTYNQTYDYADEEWKMKRVDKVYSFMRLYPVPAPLNLIALVYDLIVYIVRAVYDQLCCKKKRSVKPQVAQTSSERATSRDSMLTEPSAKAPSDTTKRACSFAADLTDSSALKPEGANAEPTSRLQSALSRQSTRVRLMTTTDDSVQGALSLYSQDEAERAEDVSRHSWLEWLETNNIASTAMGKKEDQILAAVKRIFRDGGEVREKVDMLFAKVEKLELRSLEDRQKGDERFDLQKKLTSKNLSKHLREPHSPTRSHRPAPELGAPAAQLAQPARTPAAQPAQPTRAPVAPVAPHVAPGALQPVGAPPPGTGHGQLKKVINVVNVVSRPAQPLIRPLPPLLRGPVPPPKP